VESGAVEANGKEKEAGEEAGKESEKAGKEGKKEKKTMVCVDWESNPHPSI
jgi:hypothetical protein